MQLDTKLDLVNKSKQFAQQGGNILVIAIGTHKEERNGEIKSIENTIALCSGDLDVIIDALVGMRAKQLDSDLRQDLEEVVNKSFNQFFER